MDESVDSKASLDISEISKEPRLRLKRPPEKPPKNTVQKRRDPEFSKFLLKWPLSLKPVPVKTGTDKDGTEDCEEDGEKKTSSPPRASTLSIRTRTDSEIKNDPEFSKFLLKWPPEGSALKGFRSVGQVKTRQT